MVRKDTKKTKNTFNSLSKILSRRPRLSRPLEEGSEGRSPRRLRRGPLPFPSTNTSSTSGPPVGQCGTSGVRRGPSDHARGEPRAGATATPGPRDTGAGEGEGRECGLGRPWAGGEGEGSAGEQRQAGLGTSKAADSHFPKLNADWGPVVKER